MTSIHVGLLAGLWEFPSVELTNAASSDKETWEKISSSFLTDPHLIVDSTPLGKVHNNLTPRAGTNIHDIPFCQCGAHSIMSSCNFTQTNLI